MNGINSMTGYASYSHTIATGTITIEIKSVNSRYFEASFKMSESLRYLEPKLREILKTTTPRGKFDCSISIIKENADSLELNQDLIKSLMNKVNYISSLTDKSVLNPLDVINFPGVIIESKDNKEELEADIFTAFKATLKEFVSNRESEGSRLAQTILNRLELIEKQLVIVKENLDSLTKLEREKIKAKIEKLALDINVDPERIEQEVVLQAQKSDIAEEYDRLNSHIKAVKNILENGGSCGKRLDFMMQEFNREANTMASKASSLDITSVAVELKVLIEQMREQVQNID